MQNEWINNYNFSTAFSIRSFSFPWNCSDTISDDRYDWGRYLLWLNRIGNEFEWIVNDTKWLNDWRAEMKRENIIINQLYAIQQCIKIWDFPPTPSTTPTFLQPLNTRLNKKNIYVVNLETLILVMSLIHFHTKYLNDKRNEQNINLPFMHCMFVQH